MTPVRFFVSLPVYITMPEDEEQQNSRHTLVPQQKVRPLWATSTTVGYTFLNVALWKLACSLSISQLWGGRDKCSRACSITSSRTRFLLIVYDVMQESRKWCKQWWSPACPSILEAIALATRTTVTNHSYWNMLIENPLPKLVPHKETYYVPPGLGMMKPSAQSFVDSW